MKSTHVRSNSLGDFPLRRKEGENANLGRSLKKRKLEDMLLKLSPTEGNKNEQENKYLRQMLGETKKLGKIIETAKSESGQDATKKDIRDLIGKVCRASLLVEQNIDLSVGK
ncbi:hypothetical protein HHI36_013142 [Cryptolaemus montrouzieri]|uniref:Uncharacterized protein n=1 Tax=Cryptolaemus montrouzieri TaxID=559131 RepID=A0ABD2NGF7_9CUCU